MYHEDEPVYRSLSANGHIDEFCRFVSEDHILLADLNLDEYSNDSDRITKQRLDAAYDLLKGESCHKGLPYKITRIPVPESLQITINKDDALYGIWMYYKEKLGMDTLRDGTPFRTAFRENLEYRKEALAAQMRFALIYFSCRRVFSS